MFNIKKNRIEQLINSNERIIIHNSELREELRVFKEKEYFEKQKTCKHYWIERGRDFLNTGEYLIKWECKHCRISEDEYDKNK